MHAGTGCRNNLQLGVEWGAGPHFSPRPWPFEEPPLRKQPAPREFDAAPLSGHVLPAPPLPVPESSTSTSTSTSPRTRRLRQQGHAVYNDSVAIRSVPRARLGTFLAAAHALDAAAETGPGAAMRRVKANAQKRRMDLLHSPRYDNLAHRLVAETQEARRHRTHEMVQAADHGAAHTVTQAYAGGGVMREARTETLSFQGQLNRQHAEEGTWHPDGSSGDGDGTHDVVGVDGTVRTETLNAAGLENKRNDHRGTFKIRGNYEGEANPHLVHRREGRLLPGAGVGRRVVPPALVAVTPRKLDEIGGQLPKTMVGQDDELEGPCRVESARAVELCEWGQKNKWQMESGQKALVWALGQEGVEALRNKSRLAAPPGIIAVSTARPSPPPPRQATETQRRAGQRVSEVRARVVRKKRGSPEAARLSVPRPPPARTPERTRRHRQVLRRGVAHPRTNPPIHIKGRNDPNKALSQEGRQNWKASVEGQLPGDLMGPRATTGPTRHDHVRGEAAALNRQHVQVGVLPHTLVGPKVQPRTETLARAGTQNRLHNLAGDMPDATLIPATARELAMPTRSADARSAVLSKPGAANRTLQRQGTLRSGAQVVGPLPSTGPSTVPLSKEGLRNQFVSQHGNLPASLQGTQDERKGPTRAMATRVEQLTGLGVSNRDLGRDGTLRRGSLRATGATPRVESLREDGVVIRTRHATGEITHGDSGLVGGAGRYMDAFQDPTAQTEAPAADSRIQNTKFGRSGTLGKGSLVPTPREPEPRTWWERHPAAASTAAAATAAPVANPSQQTLMQRQPPQPQPQPQPSREPQYRRQRQQLQQQQHHHHHHHYHHPHHHQRPQLQSHVRLRERHMRRRQEVLEHRRQQRRSTARVAPAEATATSVRATTPNGRHGSQNLDSLSYRIARDKGTHFDEEQMQVRAGKRFATRGSDLTPAYLQIEAVQEVRDVKLDDSRRTNKARWRERGPQQWSPRHRKNRASDDTPSFMEEPWYRRGGSSAQQRGGGNVRASMTAAVPGPRKEPSPPVVAGGNEVMAAAATPADANNAGVAFGYVPQVPWSTFSRTDPSLRAAKALKT